MRDFRIDIPDAELTELVRRLESTRWPESELEPGWASGVPLAWLRASVDRWAHDYDWRAREARFNEHRQVIARVDGLDIHAAVLPAAAEPAAPGPALPGPAAPPAIVLTHGWPGTFAEYLGVARRLADPARYGGDPHDAMTVVVPSLPGYGFSGKPTATGWGIDRIADAWAGLMTQLGHTRFFAAGSDWGSSVSASLGARHRERMLGVTLIPPLAPPDPATAASATPAERRAGERLRERETDGSAYSAVHATRPQTIAAALSDSPAGLLAWIAEKYVTWSGSGGVDLDDILDAASIYWFTGTAGSSARLYRESIDDVSGFFSQTTPDPIDVPTGGIMFPDEVPWMSRRWAERRFPDLRVWHEPDAGGHFGALEQPDAVVAGILATVRACRADGSAT